MALFGEKKMEVVVMINALNIRYYYVWTTIITIIEIVNFAFASLCVRVCVSMLCGVNVCEWVSV